tara:strand:+ start:3003 stop:3380 length:378 start_codon:yes stop_codon:yes gene_type:complete
MKILNTLNTYKTLNSVQSKYFYGVTSGDNPREIATAKQLWKLQDLSNKLYHYYYAIESVLDCDENAEIMNALDDTKRMIDELSELSLPMSKTNTDKKIKLLIDMLESTLPKFSKLVQDYKFNKSA